MHHYVGAPVEAKKSWNKITYDINRLINKVKVAVYCLVYLGESFILNLIAQATTSLENMPAVVKKTVMPTHPKSRVWEYFGDRRKIVLFHGYYFWFQVEMTIKYSENIVVIVTFCLGQNYKSITKVSHFHFLNIWMIGQKGENCYYSTTRSSSKIFRVGYE